MTRKSKTAAVVPLATNAAYADRAVSVYSPVVITCIGVQVLFFFAIISYWSGGLRLARWSENEKRKEWAHESEESVMWTKSSLLLFWYYQEEPEKGEKVREGREEEWKSMRRPTVLENIRGSISWIAGRRP
jgi:hypothetical protein